MSRQSSLSSADTPVAVAIPRLLTGYRPGGEARCCTATLGERVEEMREESQISERAGYQLVGRSPIFISISPHSSATTLYRVTRGQDALGKYRKISASSSN